MLSIAIESYSACMTASKLGKASVDFLVVTSCLLHSHACHSQAMKCIPHHCPLLLLSSWQTSFVFLMEACHPPCVCSSCSAHACAMIHAACSTHAVPGHAAAITPATAAHTVVLDSRRHELSEASCQRRKAASYGSSKPTLQHADLTCSERHCSRLK